MNNSNVMFRKALNGYNKDDVNKYIEETSLRAKKRDEQYEQEIKQLKEDYTLARAEADEALKRDFSAEAAEFESKIAALTEQLKEANDNLFSSERSCDALKEELEENKKLVLDMKARLEESRLEIEKSAPFAEKARMYDSVSARLGEVMMSAGEAGDRLLSEAKTKSEEIVADARRQKARIMALLDTYSEKYCDRLSKVALDEAQATRDNVARELTAFAQKLASVTSQANTSAAILDKYVENLRAAINEKLESAINSSIDENMDFEGKSELDNIFCAEIEKILSGADIEEGAE